jgi:hypothetical protein
MKRERSFSSSPCWPYSLSPRPCLQVSALHEPFALSPETTYNTPTSLNASKAYFGPGAFVGVLTNAKGEAKSLWLLE